MCVSLQRLVRDRILSFHAVEEFCKSSVEGVFFVVIEKEEMVEFPEELEARYSLGSTVPGARICHHFQPTSVSSVEGKHLSINIAYPVNHSFSELPDLSEKVASLKPNDFVTCLFDGFWLLALINSINGEEKDFTCKFMHSHGRANKFYWPWGGNKGYVPFDKIMMKLATTTTSVNGRQYFIQDEELKETNDYVDRFKNDVKICPKFVVAKSYLRAPKHEIQKLSEKND